jgi:hypothetical protein
VGTRAFDLEPNSLGITRLTLATTGVSASANTSTGGVTLSAADGRNIEISTLSSAAIASNQTGIALNGSISGDRTVTTFRSGIDLNSTSSTGIVVIASASGATATGLVTIKEWIASQDVRTRRQPKDQTDHYNMDGVKLPMNAKFQVPNINGSLMGENGRYDPMDHPCDSKGNSTKYGAANVCNCRCTLGYEAVRGANGKLLTLVDNPPIGRIAVIWNALQNVIGQTIGKLIASLIQ